MFLPSGDLYASLLPSGDLYVSPLWSINDSGTATGVSLLLLLSFTVVFSVAAGDNY